MDIPIWQTLLILCALVAVNVLTAIIEVAVNNLNDARLMAKLADDERRLAYAQKVGSQSARLSLSLQIVSSFVSLLASAKLALACVQPFGKFLRSIPIFARTSPGTLSSIALVLITLLFCALLIALGYRVPKRVATKRMEGAPFLLLRLAMFFSALFAPMHKLIVGLTHVALRLFQIDPAESDRRVTEEEIRAMVDIGEEKGAIETNEKELIENIFEFNNMTAEDCMIHRTDVEAISIDDTPEEIVSTIEQTGLSRFPVYGKDIDDILGILTTRDYLLNARRELPKSLRELLRPAYFVPEVVRTDRLLKEMQSRKTHMAIVVDEYGGTSGLVTMEDLLEEIVGNIYDEYDPTIEQEIIVTEDGWRVAGCVDLEVLSELTGVPLIDEDDEYDTVGGLIYSQLTAIPEDGSHPTVQLSGLQFTVEEITDRRIEWAFVSKVPEPEAGDGESSEPMAAKPTVQP